MWQTYCYCAQKVQQNMFLMAVEQFLRVQLRFSDDMISELLTPPNRVALVTALDKDGNGKVRRCLLQCVCLCAGLRFWLHGTPDVQSALPLLAYSHAHRLCAGGY
jgi:hypothetical protein